MSEVRIVEEIYRALNSYTKRTIGLSTLEVIVGKFFSIYDEYAQFILKLENEGILDMVKSKGRTSRKPSLAYQYRINKSFIQASFHQEIQNYRNKLHPSINLDEYYKKDPSIWQLDLPYLVKIDTYIKAFGFPKDTVPAPERSFELVQDEKWLTEKGGKELLERIGLIASLKIIPVSDPLMFAINPNQVLKETQYHLIVENKTTYQGLLPALKSTNFSTLIYGRGKNIIHSIEQFPDQYPANANHHFFYFGDIDREGVSIWHSLSKKRKINLAMPFYKACIEKQPVTGKDYQKQFKEAQVEFISLFSEKEQEQIEMIFSQGKYYPQEILKSKELQEIWEGSDWRTWTYGNY